MTIRREGVARGRPTSIADLRVRLLEQAYIPGEPLAMALHLALGLERPILLEGEPGVGKTSLAMAVADMMGLDLIRLQCYEGLDANQAIYEWDYPRQLLYLRSMSDERADSDLDQVFGSRFLVERPLLAAVRAGSSAVLLIDEVDRADEQFEAFLLELLSEFQVTIPEIGTIRAASPPVVILTSNRTRDLHGALLRRCLYHWIDLPTREQELEVLALKVPALPPRVAAQVVDVVARIRSLELDKSPGLAETVEWAQAIQFVGTDEADVSRSSIKATISALIKGKEDLATVVAQLDRVLEGVGV